MEQLREKYTAENSSNKKPTTKNIFKNQDMEKKYKIYPPVQLNNVLILGGTELQHRSLGLINACTTKPGTPDHVIVLALKINNLASSRQRIRSV